MDAERGRTYRAYLLRCWQAGEAGPGQAPAWRFSLDEVGGEQGRRGFGSLEALVAFLRAELMGEAGGGEDETGD